MEGPAIGQEVGLARVRRRWRLHHGSDRGRAEDERARTEPSARGGIQRADTSQLCGCLFCRTLIVSIQS